jgi:hypothetical protein
VVDTPDSGWAFSLFSLHGLVFLVFNNFGHPEMISLINLALLVLCYSFFAFFDQVFSHTKTTEVAIHAASLCLVATRVCGGGLESWSSERIRGNNRM